METMTVRQILSESSNVGTITIAEKLGGPQLASWIDRFGFGKRTGVDFPGESPGMVLPYADWSGSTRSAPCRSARASPSRRSRW